LSSSSWITGYPQTVGIIQRVRSRLEFTQMYLQNKQGRNLGEKYMSKKLFYIKLVHTIIWVFYVFVICYILYAGIYNKINIYTWIAIGLVIFEGIILITFKGKCPCTILGYKYTNNPEIGFDIFLPKWLAKNNIAIFTTIFIIGVITIIYRLIKM
jgi:hypothetical protein